MHIDTVPANTGWSRDPWTAELDSERVWGLGSADTKGAAAAVLVALERTRPRDVGILFSGDEERSGSCVRAFIEAGHARGIERAIICEPTRRTAGIAHRGVIAARASVRGKGGHSSAADHMPKPIVAMARVAVALDELAKRHLHRGPVGMQGLCVNVASIEGGVAFNVVPRQRQLAMVAATVAWHRSRRARSRAG